MPSDQYVEYDLETKTATQYVGLSGGIDGSWFGGKSLNDVVADFAVAVDALIAKWQNKPVKIFAEYISADGRRVSKNREVTFTELKLAWETTPWGDSTMEMNLYLNGVRPMTEEEIQGMKVQEQNRRDQQRGWRQKQFDELKGEFEPNS